MNKKVMGKAGYFGKIVLLLARTLSMSLDVSDCRTNHLVEYEIKTLAHLKKLNGKYYKENKDDADLSIINYKKDKHLIGKKIYTRSAVTCKLGDCVCPTCIGNTAVANLDIADGLSAFESEEITKVVNQNILSTKHLLTTNSKEIEFNDEFNKFFYLLGGEINPNVNNNEFIDNIEDYAIYIDPDSIARNDEQDYDSSFNTYISTGKFYIRNIANPTEPDIEIVSESNDDIYISDEALELMKNKSKLIYFKDLDDDTKLFEITVMNKELTRSLTELMNLINKQREENLTINDMCQKMLDILIGANISANIVAGELIINRLLRSVKHPYDRPDFSQEDLEPYEIYTVNRALLQNKSPLVGLTFENIKKQLLSDSLYEERNGSSFIDPFFDENVNTDNLYTYDYITSNKDELNIDY